jgi:hypothetical protein
MQRPFPVENGLLNDRRVTDGVGENEAVGASVGEGIDPHFGFLGDEMDFERNFCLGSQRGDKIGKDKERRRVVPSATSMRKNR